MHICCLHAYDQDIDDNYDIDDNGFVKIYGANKSREIYSYWNM